MRLIPCEIDGDVALGDTTKSEDFELIEEKLLMILADLYNIPGLNTTKELYNNIRACFVFTV